jgi:hypothetical protein
MSMNILALAGLTSGVATLTAPAVAGTITNPITISNSLQLPSGTVYNIGGDTGISRISAGVLGIGTGAAGSTAGGLVAIDVQATWNGTVGTSPQVLAGDVLCARSSTTGAILFGIGNAGVGASNYWYWDGTNMYLGAGALNVGNVTGVSAGPFTAVTSITTHGGIVTTLSGTSDERLKDAELYEGGLGVILAINPVRYKWNAKGQAQTGLSGDQEFVGFLAQDVQKAIPEAITATEPSKDGTETYLSLDDRPIIAALVNAVKELTARIKVLEAR